MLLPVAVAKKIEPQKMYFITRRVQSREWRLSPGPVLNAIFNYVVPQVAAKRNVRLAAMCVMSTHWHAVAGTEERNLPDFTRDVHSELARVINTVFGWRGNLWEVKNKKNDENDKPLEDDESVIRAIAYTVAKNPVCNGGVRYAKSWPGVRVAWPAKDRTFGRVRQFYRSEKEGGKMPKQVVRRLERPFGFEGVSDDALAARIAKACDDAEHKAREEVLESGGSFRTRRQIRRQNRYARSTSEEPFREVRRRIHVSDPEKRKQLIEERLRFQHEYAEALKKWRAGDRDVVFPWGTYKMVVVHGAKMEPPPLARA